jgi:hypothetical protein
MMVCLFFPVGKTHPHVPCCDKQPVATMPRNVESLQLSTSLEFAMKRALSVHSILGCAADDHGYHGKATLLTAVLPNTKDNLVRHAVVKALREVFPDNAGNARLMQLACDRLDTTEKPLGFVDAADILRERGHTDLEILRLVGEFAKDLLLVAKEDKRFKTIGDAQFGLHGVVEKEISLYHRVDDSRLIEHVLASFRERPLFKGVMCAEPKTESQWQQHPEEPTEHPAFKRRKLLLNQRGRGRRVQAITEVVGT